MPAESITAAPPKNQLTILYEAFGNSSTLKKDWGYSALIEYGGKRILFDTGNNAELLKHNVETLKIDLQHLDFVVISNRSADSRLARALPADPPPTMTKS